MQKMPKVAALAVMAKITHHHRGARCSTTSEIRCVSQLKLRRFRTSGTWAIRRFASWISDAAGAPFIFNRATPVIPPPGLRCRHLWRLAFLDLDCEDGPDNSFAERRSDNRESDNCGLVVSSSKRGSPDP